MRRFFFIPFVFLMGSFWATLDKQDPLKIAPGYGVMTWSSDDGPVFSCGELGEEACWKGLRNLMGAHWEQGGSKHNICVLPDSVSGIPYGCLDRVVEHN